ncbi:hypothetical protein CG51_11040 [Haematobacter missouriensis]|uniref:DUF4148 domain-containing protein n=1 Tax=Haematobacter missouriensis TaxID=366616 RepID=A0A212AYE7_9RHOB|nr:hypothetical protein [Haematobacter missouriensis]KFI27303.1 hypothetical protein CG51_11040 [Haematobacter missouriensis]OWJ77529.1 hypothetical protein CDV53_05420 [Haematobacter missouriensis]OWJ86446.1 hypothetical protein CDV52_00335 [Haematobacter missouriensis]
MFAKTIMTVALLGLAAPVMAQGVNAGKAQLAAELGVDPTRFSTNELIQLDSAKRHNDTERMELILNHDASVTRGAQNPTAIAVPDYAND